ncbi:MAG TPA: exo-alpha-sialidase, partial [Bacteroidetes bacterium]|nr:exo-alpha-sialidase [Bacteroidota bacterium]HIL56616.1 exo-alpha-sialidase [Rhodothermales bacterium]
MRLLPLFFLVPVALAVLLGGAASAQPTSGGLPPGEGFDWERLGTPAFDANFLTVAPDGSLWSSGASVDYEDAIYVFDEATDAWRDTTSIPNDADNLAFLGPDTLLVRYISRVRRSTDGGSTWELIYTGGDDLLHVAPFDLPRSGGRVFTGASDRENRVTEGLAYSADRGGSFIEGIYDPDLFGTDDIRAGVALAVTRGPEAGRVLMGGMHGVAYSDDGGESYRPSNLWTLYRYRSREIMEGEGPDGQPRLFALLTDATQPYFHVTHSDDGGATWGRPMPLPEPQDGIGSTGELVWLGPMGQPRSTLAILPRGHIYRTDDGGDSWSLKGRAPFDSSAVYVDEAYVDDAGRLVVSTPHVAGPVHGVFRTVEPVPVASAPMPPAAPDLSLAVEPNPATRQTAVRWRQASAGAARVS